MRAQLRSATLAALTHLGRGKSRYNYLGIVGKKGQFQKNPLFLMIQSITGGCI
jgi:hypothetical protein